MTHVNSVPFQGVLTYVDTISDSAPAGAQGHRVIMTRKAAEDALPTLIGMGVNWSVTADRHLPSEKCGVIMEAVLVDDALVVSGCLWANDRKSDVISIQASAEPLGMSYELAGALVQDLRAEVWRLTRVTFTGAAVLIRSKAAYKNTTFDLL